MTRKKKTRKTSTIGAAKKPDGAKTSASGRVRKPGKGLKSGSRHNPEQKKAGSRGGQGRRGLQDPRLGSTKPVALVKPGQAQATLVPQAPKAEAKPKPAAPQEQDKAALLEQLENDARLNALLERLEAGEELSQAEEDYVESVTDRIEQLMDELGLTDEDDDEALFEDLGFDEEDLR
ncbi:Der GTPase-activating protein YihI [Gallaecimonas sp. GXIMD4217]|uniref:Der GTPase-activating protein YihI n=1 Tax=Gallaecimonas sp. GXIMD4217 TaxID=3131927 RepID=UPI00311AEF0B